MQEYFYDKLLLINQQIANYQDNPNTTLDRIHKVDLTLIANYNFYIALRDNIAQDALTYLSANNIIAMHLRAIQSNVELIPRNLIVSHYLYSLKSVDDVTKDRIRHIFGYKLNP